MNVLANPRIWLVAVQSQGHNIRRYSEYFLARARAYKEVKVDFVRSGHGRLKRLTVDKGLLRETECVQRQIKALLRCNVRGVTSPGTTRLC
jgi:phosphatidylinositol-binding clathrin assembly protein